MFWYGYGLPGPGSDFRGGMDGWTYVRTDGWKFSPMFYRTSSPSGPLPKRKGNSVEFLVCIPPDLSCSLVRGVKLMGFCDVNRALLMIEYSGAVWVETV